MKRPATKLSRQQKRILLALADPDISPEAGMYSLTTRELVPAVVDGYFEMTQGARRNRQSSVSRSIRELFQRGLIDRQIITNGTLDLFPWPKPYRSISKIENGQIVYDSGWCLSETGWEVVEKLSTSG